MATWLNLLDEGLAHHSPQMIFLNRYLMQGGLYYKAGKIASLGQYETGNKLLLASKS
jgi:hypothetical protein